jgi:hypothetical protein
MKLNLDTFVRFKVHIDRTRNWIGLFQFMLTLFISFKVLRASHFKAIIFNYWYLTFPAFFIGFMAICVVLGYVDFKLKIRQKENETLSNQNPVTMKMLNDLKQIKEGLNLLTNKKI